MRYQHSVDPLTTQVSGSGELNQVLVDAEEESKKMKDSFISVEHLLLALVGEGKKGSAGRFLADSGITKERVRKTLKKFEAIKRLIHRTLKKPTKL